LSRKLFQKDTGGLETIICAPVTTSHEKMSSRERAELGITDSLLRLSAGIKFSGS
jgi:cystathionine beta-lyase/cystathionine gamma-synthase